MGLVFFVVPLSVCFDACSPAFQIVGSEHPAVALESNKCIQCQQQLALLGCVTEMCPRGCVTVESLQCWGVDMGAPLLDQAGYKAASCVPTAPYLVSSQHSPVLNCLSTGSQNHT